MFLKNDSVCLAKCNANICCNCHKEWQSFSWWYQIVRIYTSMLEFQFNWNIIFHFFYFPLMNWFLYFVTRFFYLFFWYFLQIISISIFVGQGICKIVVAELFLVCKGNRKRRVSFCHNFKSSENVNYCRWFDKII